MTSQNPNRFYKSVDVQSNEDGQWNVTLDGRELRTPAKSPLNLPTRALALAVADEWAAQEHEIMVADMHVTRLVNVAVDRTGAVREEMAEEVARYAETDLVSHLADGPEILRMRQEDAWGKWRDWAAQELDVFLVPVEGIIASPQPSQSLDAAREHALKLDDLRLTALNFGLGLFGSAVLSLAVEQRELSAAEAFELSRIDEAFQIEQWGEDEEAQARVEAHRRQAVALDVFYTALDKSRP